MGVKKSTKRVRGENIDSTTLYTPFEKTGMSSKPWQRRKYPSTRVRKKDEKSKEGGRGANDRDKTCSKNWDTEKKINLSSLGISSPLESGKIERWYFDRRAR